MSRHRPAGSRPHAPFTRTVRTARPTCVAPSAPRGAALLLGLLPVCMSLTGCTEPAPPAVKAPSAPAQPKPAKLRVGPWVHSNAGPVVLDAWAPDLPVGPALKLQLVERGGAVVAEAPLHAAGPGRATSTLAAPALPADVGSRRYHVVIRGAGANPKVLRPADTITIVNDRAFAPSTRLVCDRAMKRAVVLQPDADGGFWLHAAQKGWHARPLAPGQTLGDAPVDAAFAADGTLAVVHALSADITWISPGGARETTPGVPRASGVTMAGTDALLVDALGHTLYRAKPPVYAARPASHVSRRTAPKRPASKPRITAPTVVTPLSGVDPRRIVAWPDGRVVVGHRGSGDLSIVTPRPTGSAAERVLTASPALSINKGPTAPYQRSVMGGRAVRDMATAPDLGVVFIAWSGPNTGPNADRMEVAMAGGITVLDMHTPGEERLVRHVPLPHGMPQAIAYDARSHTLAVADVQTGHFFAMDARALLGDKEAASLTPHALPLGQTGAPHTLSAAHRALPSGVCLAPGGQKALVLLRGSNEVRVLERTGKAWKASGRIALSPRPAHAGRLRGEHLYYTDVGNTRMSCDGCHLDGHNEGVLFTKGSPMHIYRVPTLRGVRDTAPYFTPAAFPSLLVTSTFVLGRNRAHRPDPPRADARALTVYQGLIAQPPQPYRAPDGRMAEKIPTHLAPTHLAPGPGSPAPAMGDPRLGKAVFDRLQCQTCHPAPLFTTDQDAATRGKMYDVGEPTALALRPEQQDMTAYPVPAPSLVGLWDTWPLLHSAAGGFRVVEGQPVLARDPWPLERVLRGPPRAAGKAREPAGHGGAGALSPAELGHLVAFLRSL